MPISLFKLKNLLRHELQNKQKSIIDKEHYQALCQQAGVDEAEQESAIKVLNNLGVALHYPEVDPSFHVLDPTLLSQSIYYLLWRSDRHDWRGVLRQSNLALIFNRKDDPKAPEVEAKYFKTLLKLLQHFELAYSVKNEIDAYRIPMLAPDNTSTLPEVKGEKIVLSTHMTTLLPPGLYYRLVTQCGAEIDGDNIWRHSCLLQSQGAIARLNFYPFEKRIVIEVWGEKHLRGQYFSRLRSRLLKLIGDESYLGLAFEMQVSLTEGTFYLM